MDAAGEKQRLENELRGIEQWLNHPVTLKVLEDNKEQQEELVQLLCDNSIVDMASACAFLEAKGHLRGLRRLKGLVDTALETVTEKIKELK